MMNYVGAGVLDMALACTGVGLSLLVRSDPRFQTDHFYSWLALLFATTGVGTALGSIYLSRLSDRFGRRPMLLISLAGLTLTTLSLGFAAAWWHLFVIMLVRSAFMGIFWPSLEARITDGAEGPEMARRLGLFGISFCAGLLLGPAAGGGLSDLGLRLPFFAAAALSLLLLILMAVVFRTDTAHDGHRSPARPDDQIEEEPLAPAPRVRRAFLLCAWIANALTYAAAAILRQIFPSFAKLAADQGGLGFTGFQAGVIGAGVGLAMLIAFVLLGHHHFWHFKFRYLLFGQIISVLGCLVFSTCFEMATLFAGSFLFGTGAGMVYIASIYYSLEGHAARAGQSGLHEGILCFGFAGGMIITAVLTRSHRTPYWICVALLLVGIAAESLIWIRARGRASR